MKVKILKNKWFYAGLIVFAGVLIFGGRSLVDYTKWREVAEAAGGMPWQFGGTITIYQPACVSDPETGVCENCPMCTVPGSGVGNYACNGYQEIQYLPATGSMLPNFVCVPQGFVYWGGGTIPRPGGQVLGGGASNIFPWVIGISK